MGRWMCGCLALVLLLLPMPLASARADGTPTAAVGDFGGLVDIGGGRRLYLESRGAGGPTVILEAGFRLSKPQRCGGHAAQGFCAGE